MGDTTMGRRTAYLAAVTVSVAGLSLVFGVPVYGAVGAGAGDFYQSARQYQWRPTRADAGLSRQRWRPVMPYQRRATRSWSEQRYANRRWVRNARPLTRAGDLVGEFRPDYRFDSPMGGVRRSEGLDGGAHAQFRPLQPQKRRKTYEEMYQQVNPVPVPMSPPVPRYPAASYFVPAHPVWPRW